jgi:hypothetical protein
MTATTTHQPTSCEQTHTPLLSNSLLTRLTVGVALLASLAVAISFGGRMLGERIALAGHSESRETFDMIIGNDHLRLPANVIRFEEQRHTGTTEHADLYLTWPEMEGYSNASRVRFNDISRAESLVFLQVSQSTMSRDMSGRLEPIYRHIFDGSPTPAMAGLSLNRLRENSGYGDEVFFTASLPDGARYAVRCMMPTNDALSTGADCQRDIHIGNDLSVLYRFSSRLLPQWQAMEASVRDYFTNSLVRDGRASPASASRQDVGTVR